MCNQPTPIVPYIVPVTPVVPVIPAPAPAAPSAPSRNGIVAELVGTWRGDGGGVGRVNLKLVPCLTSIT